MRTGPAFVMATSHVAAQQQIDRLRAEFGDEAVRPPRDRAALHPDVRLTPHTEIPECAAMTGHLRRRLAQLETKQVAQHAAATSGGTRASPSQRPSRVSS